MGVDTFNKYSRYWYSPNKVTPDIFSYLYKDTGLLKLPLIVDSDRIPFFSDFYKYQCWTNPNLNYHYEIVPITGNNFVEILSSGFVIDNNQYYFKETIQSPIRTIEKNKKYSFNFTYNIHPLTYYLSRSIDVMFSKKANIQNITNSYEGYNYKAKPDLSFPLYELPPDWRRIFVTFKSKDSFSYITIGCFDTIFKTLPIIDSCFNNTTNLFLDDICLYEIRSIVGPDTVCINETVPLTSSLGMPYYWSLDANGNDTLSKDSIFYYKAVKTQMIYAFGKYAKDSLLLYADTFSKALFKDTVQFCSGDGFILDGGLKTTYSKYTWNTTETGQSISISSPGKYTLTKTNIYRCVQKDSIIAIMHDLPTIEMEETYSLCKGIQESIIINAGNHYSCYWSPINYNQCQIITSYTGKLLLTVRNENNCKAEKEINIIDNCDLKVFIPNAFTPVGNNPVFVPVVAYGSEISMQIFNRWGEKLFEQKGPQVGWDGIYQGEYCMEGIYFYIIKVKPLDGGGELMYKAFFRLLQ